MINDLIDIFMHQALPWVVTLVGNLGSLVAEPDQLLSWIESGQLHHDVRNHLVSATRLLMALTVLWMAWQTLWTVQRIVRTMISVTVKLMIAGMVLAVVWNVYSAAMAGAEAGGPGPTAPTSGTYAYERPRAAATGGLLDHLFSAAKDEWMRHRDRNRRHHHRKQHDDSERANDGEYSYAWSSRKYRDRAEAEMGDEL